MILTFDINTRKSKLGRNLTRAVNGPFKKPLILRIVWQTAQTVKIPVIGGAGITNAEDALEFFIAGATSVEIGTYNLVDPRITIKIIKDIKEYLIHNRIKHIRDIIDSFSLS